jgi:hypothetical protein
MFWHAISAVCRFSKLFCPSCVALVDIVGRSTGEQVTGSCNRKVNAGTIQFSSIQVSSVLFSSSDSPFGAFLFLFNHPKGLHVQLVCFERGKYWIFKSDGSLFHATQLKRTILNDLEAKATPFLDKVERDNALRFALRETRSLAVLRGLEKRDRIVLAIGAISLGVLFYGTLLLDWNKENASGIGLLIILAVAAELSYRKLDLVRLLRRRH